MIKTLCIVAIAFTAALASYTPAANFQIEPLLRTNLNAVVYNNVNDTFAVDCLSFYFEPEAPNTLKLNTTLWADPKPETFTFTYSESQLAVWSLNPTLNITWVFADYANEVYAFADSLMMTTYVLSPNWDVSSILIGKAIGAIILAKVPILPKQLSLTPANCSHYPLSV